MAFEPEEYYILNYKKRKIFGFAIKNFLKNIEKVLLKVLKSGYKYDIIGLKSEKNGGVTCFFVK